MDLREQNENRPNKPTTITSCLAYMDDSATETHRYMAILPGRTPTNSGLVDRSTAESKVEGNSLAYVQPYIFTPYSEQEVQDFIKGNAWCLVFDEEVYNGGQICPNYRELRALYTKDAWRMLDANCRVFLWIVHTMGVKIPAELMNLAGVDFHFTRQGHGTGFWDKPEVYGELTDKLGDACGDGLREVYAEKGAAGRGQTQREVITRVYGGYMTKDLYTYGGLE